MRIIEIKGDVLKSDAGLILHQCNTLGIMGGGLAKQVRDQYPGVYFKYVRLCDEYGEGLLGRVQYCGIGGGRVIGNVFGQTDIGSDGCKTDYDALGVAFGDVARYVSEKGIRKVAVPKLFGCGLAGGQWSVVLGIIVKAFNDLDIDLEIVEFSK